MRSGRWSELDAAHLAEELEEKGNNKRDALESRLGVLLLHLLKWQFQPNLRSRSWENTIKVQRRDIAKLLRRNPGLKSKLAECSAEAYDDARFMAVLETGLEEERFPVECPFGMDEVLGEG